tara:strand:- start:11854 stop:11958 length:105 start_codon:yes stop_codon:yes gene_type:complete
MIRPIRDGIKAGLYTFAIFSAFFAASGLANYFTG